MTVALRSIKMSLGLTIRAALAIQAIKTRLPVGMLT